MRIEVGSWVLGCEKGCHHWAFACRMVVAQGNEEFFHDRRVCFFFGVGRQLQWREQTSGAE